MCVVDAVRALRVLRVGEARLNQQQRLRQPTFAVSTTPSQNPHPPPHDHWHVGTSTTVSKAAAAAPATQTSPNAGSSTSTRPEAGTVRASALAVVFGPCAALAPSGNPQHVPSFCLPFRWFSQRRSSSPSYHRRNCSLPPPPSA